MDKLEVMGIQTLALLRLTRLEIPHRLHTGRPYIMPLQQQLALIQAKVRLTDHRVVIRPLPLPAASVVLRVNPSEQHYRQIF